MAIPTETVETRTPLSRERVLRAAVALADRDGIEALSMRNLAEELGVKAMSLYNHVANKEDLLDGVVDVIVGEIDLSSNEVHWKSAARERMLNARDVLVRHPWAYRVIETRKTMTPTMMRYFDSFIGILRDGGVSLDLTHHAAHALGSRVLGFVQELYDDSEALEASPEAQALMLQQLTAEFPNISELAIEISHDEDSILGTGCDDLVEFEFAIDLILDGLERLQDAE